MSKADLFALPVPLEDDEQISFVSWLELCGLRFSAIPMNTYTKYMSQKMKNQRMGVRAGVPDMIVLIPPQRSNDGEGHLLFIEMKRRKGGVLSPEQREWLAALTALASPNVEALVAKGWDDAREAVLIHLKGAPVSMF